jgi:hypothetical protein
MNKLVETPFAIVASVALAMPDFSRGDLAMKNPSSKGRVIPSRTTG